MIEWIPVSQPPSSSETVLATDGEYIFEAYLWQDDPDTISWGRDDEGCCDNITHWAPMPVLPQGDEA